MKFEINELRKLIENICEKNICRATKEMALSHLISLEAQSQSGIPAEDRYGHEPDKAKPLAQYLSEYIDHEADLGNLATVPPFVSFELKELLEQALDAYESTENVKIRIEPI